MQNAYLRFESVNKSFGSITALQELNFSVHAGESIALLGSNGAGKSTFINLAAGIRRPDSGEIGVFGYEPGSIDSKRRMRILTQELNFPSQLKVREVLQLVAGHYESSDYLNLAEELDVHLLLDRNIQKLSGGEKKRIGIICTLIGQPDLILLDEPTSNIDLQGRRLVYKCLKNFLQNKQRSLIFSSHQMQEVEFLADKIFVLKQGRVVTSGTTKEIKNKFGLKKVFFRTHNNNLAIDSSQSLVRDNNLVTLLGSNSDEMLKEVISKDPAAFDIHVEDPSLDEIFIKIWDKKGATL